MLDKNKLKFLILCQAGLLLGSLDAEPNLEKTIKETYFDTANEPGAVLFNPPSGWGVADPKALPPSVQIMVIGKGSHEFPPSMALAVEPWDGTLKDYLKRVKAINEARKEDWKDLGSIRTEAGEASLSQVESKTKWGETKEMHVILLKNKMIYILSAAALKAEFPKFYKEFFNSFYSLRINKDAYEMVADPSRRAALVKATQDLKKNWHSLLSEEEKANQSPYKEVAAKLFASQNFQEQYWSPFQSLIKQDFADMGPAWQKHMLARLEKELLD